MIRTLIALLLLSLPAVAQLKFAVSGDSRNCGSVVMPLIAADVQKQSAEFYWHLGDLRAMSDFDQDMSMRADRTKRLSINEYANTAWQDFINNQIHPFGDIPFYIGLGNHEMGLGRTRADFIAQFADWLSSPTLRRQRLLDDPRDHKVKTWYHWIQGGVDFIYLDNATSDQFERAQMSWFTRTLKSAESNPAVKTVVLGTHAALPDSLASAHSMNDTPQQTDSGRRVYNQLIEFRQKTGKRVYLLASHSHYLMANIFNTEENRAKNTVLPGWIVGTAGAYRYRLPEGAKQADMAQTNVYGYLLGTVQTNGEIKFDFREVKESDVPPDARAKYGQELMNYCFQENRDK
ncbi:MAG TPA: hypothetical protein VN577_16450 [Terriglobales bacterium]|nr:hypothetical protein [Terriglobales bacterium]